MDAVLRHLADGEHRYLDELTAFVGIPSVSTDPVHASDVRRAAEWVATRLRRAGDLHVEIWETARHPAVFGRWDGASGAPTVLVYGHMDVQPPDPLDKWESPPFVLTARNGRLYGRGVSDDKASMLIPILVTEAFFAAGTRPPVNLRFLFEAEEEVGSPSLPGLVDAHRDALACDVVYSADGGMWRAETPSVTVSARGLVSFEFTVRGPRKDLHSGRHGGGVANPLHAAAELVASFHEDGRVAVDGFYDDVEPVESAVLAAVDRLPFDEAAYLESVGAPAFGEPGYGTLARQWYRPTLEVNGLYGGYQGPGGKTVLPSEAHVKVTCRLVPNQRPADILEKVRRHLERHCPPGVALTIVEDVGHGAEAYRVSQANQYVQAAVDTLAEVFRGPVDVVGMGGTVPVTTTFRHVLGVDTVFFSFSVADEDIHAPNEFYRPERFRLGLEAWARLWSRLATLPR